eukprot:7001037-Heterocapsa_arctica.AAC.1
MPGIVPTNNDTTVRRAVARTGNGLASDLGGIVQSQTIPPSRGVAFPPRASRSSSQAPHHQEL